MKEKMLNIILSRLEPYEKVDLIYSLFYPDKNDMDKNIDFVINTIGNYFCIEQGWNFKKTRVKKYTNAKHVLRAILRDIFPLSLSLAEIGTYNIGSDHSTVHNSVRKVVPSWEVGDKRMWEDFNKIKDIIIKKIQK